MDASFLSLKSPLVKTRNGGGVHLFNFCSLFGYEGIPTRAENHLVQFFFGATFLFHFGYIMRIYGGKAHGGYALIMCGSSIHDSGFIWMLR
jgi:hypothetical protein